MTSPLHVPRTRRAGRPPGDGRIVRGPGRVRHRQHRSDDPAGRPRGFSAHPGVYSSASSASSIGLTGEFVLDGAGDINHAGLRLITCGGSFDRQARGYVDNLIVFAELVGAVPV